MSRSIRYAIVAAVAAMAAGALAAPTARAQVTKPLEVGQSPPIPKGAPKPKRLADGHPNITGFWTQPNGLLDVYRGPSGVTTAPGLPPIGEPSPPAKAGSPPTGGAAPPPTNGGGRRPPPYTPLKEPFKSQHDAFLKQMAAGKVVDTVALCFPPGMPRMMGGIYGLEILQTPGQITITSEWQAASRRIWMNEKKHPPLEELDPTFTGHSIGHWEGDTLVVDTVGIRNDVPLDYAGLPHSDKLHLVERFTIHGGQLVDDLTVDDPGAFEGPWKLKYSFHYRPDLKLEEYVCEENNRNVGANGEAAFGK